MPLPLIADKLDAIPEAARGAYVEREGKFHLDAEVEDVSAVKKKSAELLDETKKERAARQKLEREMEALRAEADAKAAGLTTEKLAEIQQKAEARFKGDLEERDRLRQENRALKLDSAIKGKLGPHVHDAEAAWKLIADQFDLTEDGKPIVKADPTANLDAYIEGKVKEQYPFLFKGTQADGSGARGSRGSGPAPESRTPTKWTTDQIAEFRQKHGDAAYMKLLEEEQRALLMPKPKEQKAA